MHCHQHSLYAAVYPVVLHVWVSNLNSALECWTLVPLTMKIMI